MGIGQKSSDDEVSKLVITSNERTIFFGNECLNALPLCKRMLI